MSIRRFSAKLAAPLAILLLTSSCGGGGSSSNNTNSVGISSGSGVPQPNVVPIPADGSVTFSNVTPSSVTLNGKIPPLKPGMVIAGGMAPGIMRKIVSAVQTGTVATVQTTDATLSDVFQKLSLKYSGPLMLGAPSQPLPNIVPNITGSNVQIGHTASVGPMVSTAPSQTFNLPPYLSAANGSAAVNLNGSATVGMYLDCDIELDTAHDVHFARFIPTVVGSVNVSASATAAASLSVEPINYYTLPCEPIVIWVAGIPTSITPQIKIYAKADGEVQAGVNAQATGSLTIGAGIQYEDGTGWSRIQKFDPKFTATSPFDTPRADATFHITPVNIDLEAIIDGIGGPYANVDCPRFTIGVHTSPNPPLTVDADFEGDVGVRTDFLGGAKLNTKPIQGPMIHLFPTGKIEYGEYEETSPVGNDSSWHATTGVYSPSTDPTATNFEWIYSETDQYGDGFDVDYAPSSNVEIDDGQTYNLKLSHYGIVNNYSGPQNFPSQIAVTLHKLSGSTISVEVAGAPSWMMPPPAMNTYTNVLQAPSANSRPESWHAAGPTGNITKRSVPGLSP